MKRIQEALAQVKEEIAAYPSKNDIIRWTATRENGTDVGTSTACYARALDEREGLGSLEIRCRPYTNDKRKKMPGQDYLAFFELCQSTGLLPEDIKFSVKEEENLLVIPRSGWDRHSIYIALCYYRQTDIVPGEAVKALRLHQLLAPEGTVPLQVLHYLAATTSIGPGHYFIAFGTYAQLKPTALVAGQALAWFAALSKEQRLEVYQKSKRPYSFDQDGYTSSLFDQKARELKKSQQAESVEALLHPKYAHHYVAKPQSSASEEKETPCPNRTATKSSPS